MSDYGPGGNDWFWARAPTLHQCLLKQKLNEKYLIEKKPSQEPTDNQIRNSKSSNGIGMLLFEKLTINEVKALQVGSTKVSKQ